MEHIELSEDIKEIINKLRIIGGDMDAIEIYRTSVGWQYGGSKIESQLNYLNAEFDGKRGNKVVEMKMIRFLENAIVVNPTNNLILIPVNGDAIFGNETIIPDEGYYIEEDRRPLYGHGVDLVFIVLAKN